MPNVFSLVNETATTELDVDIRRDIDDPASDVLGSIHVVYNPRRVTGTTLQAINALGKRQTAHSVVEAAAQLIESCVTEWDLTRTEPVRDGDGEPAFDGDGRPAVQEVTIPLTAEEIGDQPLQVTIAVMNAILEDMNPKARGRNGATARKSPQASPSASPKAE